MKKPEPNSNSANVRDSFMESVMDRIQAAMDRSNEERYFATLRQLPDGPRAVWATWIVECEVENGGFAQYFWNMEEEGFYDEALRGFETLAASEHHQLLKQALDLIRPYLEVMHTMQGPDDRFTKYKPLLEKDGIYDRLMELDGQFYDLRPTLKEIRTRYVKMNPSEFKNFIEPGGPANAASPHR